MIRVLVLDSTRGLNEDLNLQMVVEGYEDEFKVLVINPELIANLKEYIDKTGCNFAVVAYDTMEHVHASDFGVIKAYGYTKNKETPTMFDKERIPFLGNATNSSDILRVICDAAYGKVPKIEDLPEEEEPNMNASEKSQDDDDSATTVNKPVVVPTKQVSSKPSVQDLIDGLDDDDDDDPVPKQMDKKEVEVHESNLQQKARQNESETPRTVADNKNERQKDEDMKPAQKNTQPEQRMSRGALLRQNQMRKEREQYERVQMQEEEKKADKRTTTVAVFSAKGGVGKTTVSSNLSMYLSMMAHGRGNYRVCIVDCNIDFGDVRSTLGFSEDGVDMSTWAEDIHTQLVRGRRPEDIRFSKNQIEGYLQRNNDTGLYALLAPLMHEEAMALEGEAIQVMLRNIIENGEFDFVICDTGNNTRDSSYFALEMADIVLLVCTQDATTVTCNGSALNALKKLDFDLTKVRIIINNIVSAKQTGISAAEVEEAFSEYECIARIHRNDEVLRANNYSRPLVMKPNHPFTQELRNVVLYLTNEEKVSNPGVPKKKKFFGLF